MWEIMATCKWNKTGNIQYVTLMENEYATRTGENCVIRYIYSWFILKDLQPQRDIPGQLAEFPLALSVSNLCQTLPLHSVIRILKYLKALPQRPYDGRAKIIEWIKIVSWYFLIAILYMQICKSRLQILVDL